MIKVNVTKKHILSGVPQDANYCPIAISLRVKFKNKGHSIKVHSDTIEIITKDYIYCFGTPLEAREFIERFDYLDRETSDDFHIARKKIRPFKFNLTSKDLIVRYREKHENFV